MHGVIFTFLYTTPLTPNSYFCSRPPSLLIVVTKSSARIAVSLWISTWIVTMYIAALIRYATIYAYFVSVIILLS